jgi:hypothetical protein
MWARAVVYFVLPLGSLVPPLRVLYRLAVNKPAR